jgi:hypothetical protein
MKYIPLYFILMTSFAFAQSLPTSGNLVYIDQVGNNNITYVEQKDTEIKAALVVNKGDNNDFSISQQGTGNHIAAITPSVNAPNSSNNNNVVSIQQSGAGNHTASVLFDDPIANNNNVASIVQAGGVGANKQFTLQLQGSGITANVLQDNATTPNTGTMAIQCLTPPCTGYSYTRR